MVFDYSVLTYIVHLIFQSPTHTGPEFQTYHQGSCFSPARFPEFLIWHRSPVVVICIPCSIKPCILKPLHAYLWKSLKSFKLGPNRWNTWIMKGWNLVETLPVAVLHLHFMTHCRTATLFYLQFCKPQSFIFFLNWRSFPLATLPNKPYWCYRLWVLVSYKWAQCHPSRGTSIPARNIYIHIWVFCLHFSEHCILWTSGDFAGMFTPGKTWNFLECFPFSINLSQCRTLNSKANSEQQQLLLLDHCLHHSLLALCKHTP